MQKDPFISLFQDAYRKCFRVALPGPLSEAESRHMANDILEKTGLVIGAKSIKNYSFYASGHSGNKTENPSVATLDSFARYVLNGPYTNETARKKQEAHFPYWFRYKSSLTDEELLVELPSRAMSAPKSKSYPSASPRALALVFALVFLGLSFGLWFFSSRKPAANSFTDSFDELSADSLTKKGWSLQNTSTGFWNRRGEQPGSLTLFTLAGDNWADSSGRQGIRNLLVRALPAYCFSTEVHIDHFFPKHNWQQAGLLLMEDSSGRGRSLRVSISYNSFFGGYTRQPEIYLQIISSTADEPGKPEEIVHLPLFSLAKDEETLAKNNMQYAALRVEKTEERYRVLYAAGPVTNFAFKEALAKEIPFHPRYLGLFALEGFVPETDYQPVTFSWFSVKSLDCK